MARRLPPVHVLGTHGDHLWDRGEARHELISRLKNLGSAGIQDRDYFRAAHINMRLSRKPGPAGLRLPTRYEVNMRSYSGVPGMSMHRGSKSFKIPKGNHLAAIHKAVSHALDYTQGVFGSRMRSHNVIRRNMLSGTDRLIPRTGLVKVKSHTARSRKGKVMRVKAHSRKRSRRR